MYEGETYLRHLNLSNFHRWNRRKQPSWMSEVHRLVLPPLEARHTRQDMMDHTIYVAGVVCDMVRKDYGGKVVPNNCSGRQSRK